MGVRWSFDPPSQAEMDEGAEAEAVGPKDGAAEAEAVIPSGGVVQFLEHARMSWNWPIWLL